MVKPIRRGRRPRPARGSAADWLDDTSAFTERYDAVTDWSDGRSTFSEKLLFGSWVARYWSAGPRFRWRMLRSLALLVVAAAAAIAVAIAIS